MECQLGNLIVHYKTIGEGKPFLTISGIPSDHQIIEGWLEPILENRPDWQRIYFEHLTQITHASTLPDVEFWLSTWDA